MILPDFLLSTRKNQILTESGMDSKNDCLDKKHFENFPYQVIYEYNSRGFRDTEWPTDLKELKNAVWCFGDSFTVGIGSPIKHNWVNILQNKLNRRCVNISMDGASNKWIYRKIKRVIEDIGPELIIVQWSYLHRSESNDHTLRDEDRRIFAIKDEILDKNDVVQKEFFRLLEDIERSKGQTKIIYSSIPGTGVITIEDLNVVWDSLKGTTWPEKILSISDIESLRPDIVEELKQFKVYWMFEKHVQWYKNRYANMIYYVNQIDYARDKFHYDKLTAEKYILYFLNQISKFNLSI